MKKAVLLVLCLFSASAVRAGYPQVAYIYSSANASDSAAALAYQNLLDSTGYGTELFDTGQVASANFSVFKLIVIGPGTGSLSTWGDSAMIARLQNSGKPILGIGEGGYAFFGKISLDIGYANGAHGSDSVIKCAVLPHPILVTPQPIDIPNDSNLTLYVNAVDVVSVEFNTLPANVTILGQDPAESQRGYIIQENARYLLWGFSASESLMSADGAQLFVNTVDFMSRAFSNGKVAYIYADSTRAGNDVAAFLQPFGVSTQLIDTASVESANFAPYNLIIVDSYSGNYGTWGDPASVSNIVNSGKPVLGMGFGGASLFQQMGLSMNWGNGEDDPDTTQTFLDTVTFLSSAGAFTQTPNDILVGSAALYFHTGGVQEYIPALAADVIGIAEYNNATMYYAIMTEGIHCLWGPSNSPSGMTQVGKNLFYNMVAGRFQQVVTGVKTHTADGSLPQRFSLSQNYPNPFNPTTRIEYTLPSSSNVTLTLYNILGQHVATLVNAVETAGSKSAVWDAHAFASGVYFYKLQVATLNQPARNFVDMKKLILLK